MNALTKAQAQLAVIKGNIAFLKLSPAQKRIAIVKDCLAMLRSRSCPEITPGTYCHIPDGDNYENRSLQEILPSLQSSCRVCAMGALFLSHVRKANNVDAGDHFFDEDIIEEMKGYFSESQLRSIEKAFESTSYYDEEDTSDLSDKWYSHYPDPKKRLIAILQNMLENGGKFKISKVPSVK